MMQISVMVIPMLVCSLAITAVAQKAETVDQKTRQQIEAFVTRYVDALNNRDAQTAAAVYPPNGIVVEPAGEWKNDGAQLQQSVENLRKLGITFSAKVADIEPIFGAQGFVVVAPYTATFAKVGIPPGQGNFLFVLEHLGGSWKIDALALAATVPKPPPR